MALKPCPECGKEISDLAASCPHCGRPQEILIQNEQYDGDYQRPSTAPKEVNFEKKPKRGCVGCFFSFILLMILLGVLLYNFQQVAIVATLIAFITAWGLWVLFPVIVAVVIVCALIKYLFSD